MTTEPMAMPPAPARALAVMAHPDDIEFMAGGLVAQWARQGTEMHYLLLTDGNGGSRDPAATPESLAALRRDEQRAAAAVVGARCSFLGRQDGRLVADVALRLEIARVIRQVRPEAMIVGDPLFFYGPTYVNHPDHRAAAEAALAAVMPIANTRLAALELLEEGLEPHDVHHIYLGGAARPTLWVPLSDEDMERKLAMLSAHTSQVGNWDFKSMIRSFAVQAAAQARAEGVECELAEGFVFINLARE
jgi:LmbE family N-acetylglucosaminyl deacetylase